MMPSFNEVGYSPVPIIWLITGVKNWTIFDGAVLMWSAKSL